MLDIIPPIIWDMTPCIMVYSYWRFRGTSWLHLQCSLRKTYLYFSHISLHAEAASFSETSVYLHQSTRSDIPGDGKISQGRFWEPQTFRLSFLMIIPPASTSHHQSDKRQARTSSWSQVPDTRFSYDRSRRCEINRTRLSLPCICPFQCVAYVEGRRLSKSDIDSVKENMGKAIPLQAWANTEGSGNLGFPDFKTIGTWRW